MADTASSSISRYKPAVIVLTGLAAAASIWYIYSSSPVDGDGVTPSLHRSGAIRRRQPTTIVEDDAEDDEVRSIALIEEPLPLVPDDEGGVTARQFFDGTTARDRRVPLSRTLATQRDEDETEQSVDSRESASEGERLKELVYAIAKHNHERDGIEHHGVTCDNCGMLPILGPRFHCANCPDYDLCELCEASDCHLRTHVFFKVKVPAPWGGKDPLPLWYPGQPQKMPSSMNTEASRSLRAELSESSGFSVSKIDGFYQQFTCMANVPFTDDVLGVNMAIDRASFDHCFIQQVTMDRSLGPSLIADRLFALYDSNKDGFIDFSEFIYAMSLIRGKKPLSKIKRIFKGFDLDDDGLVERKDFLKMFKSFYTLNHEIVMGYFKAEQIGQNADLLGTTRDVEAHLAGGRSLASYFGDAPPNFEATTAWSSVNRAEGKLLNEHDDLVLPDQNRGAVQMEWDRQDLSLTAEEIEGNDYLSAFYVFHDEMLRFVNSMPLKYLNQDQVRIFDTETNLMVREADEQLWVVNFDWRRRKAVYLRMDQEDIDTEPGWRDRLEDEEYCRAFYDIVKIRMCTTFLPGKIKEEAGDKVAFYQAHRRFMTLDVDTEMPSGIEGLSILHEIPSRYAANSLRKDLVGGTAANHTISNVVISALNEMLNPLFATAETLGLEEEATVAEREQYKSEMKAHIDSLYETHWKPHANLWHVHRQSGSPYPGPKERSRIVQEHQARLRELPNDYGASMVCSYAQLSNGPPVHESEVHRLGWVALEWSLSVEAHMWADGKLDQDRSAQKNARARTAAAADAPSPTSEIVDQAYGEQILLQRRRTADEDKTQDPTMPQHRAEDRGISQQRLHHLTIIDIASKENRADGSGHIDFEYFERKVADPDPECPKLLDWVKGWVDLIIF